MMDTIKDSKVIKTKLDCMMMLNASNRLIIPPPIRGKVVHGLRWCSTCYFSIKTTKREQVFLYCLLLYQNYSLKDEKRFARKMACYEWE